MQLNNLIDFDELQFMSANEASWQLNLPIALIKIYLKVIDVNRTLILSTD